MYNCHIKNKFSATFATEFCLFNSVLMCYAVNLLRNIFPTGTVVNYSGRDKKFVQITTSHEISFVLFGS